MAVTNSVSGFLSRVKQGVRPNMFQVDIPFPEPGSDSTDSSKQELASFMCKSAALPASNVGVIEVPFRGRTVKIAGDRTFDNWSATFINDEDMKIRAYFEDWMRQINSHESNVNAVIDPTVYGKHIKVHQMEKDSNDNGKILRTYKLWWAFPTSSSAIDLAYDSNDQIEEFSVEFQYSYWTVEAGGEAQIAVP
mgnify:FL=1|tara:strand:- start:74 stop:652 length:579 start_codon:yes stop_codon:yes gene_type:complete